MPRRIALPHLELRPSGFHWRRRWPEAARPHGATSSLKSTLVFSLRTHVLADAKALARRLDRISDAVFAEATEKTMPIPAETAQRILVELARFEIEAADRARAIAPERSEDVAAWDLAREQALQETLRRALRLRDREIVRAPLRHVAERLGLSLDEADPDWMALAHEATRVLLDVSGERARRDQGNFDEPSPFFRAALAAPGAPAVRPVAFAASVAAPPAGFAATAAPGMDRGICAVARPATCGEAAAAPTAQTVQGVDEAGAATERPATPPRDHDDGARPAVAGIDAADTPSSPDGAAVATSPSAHPFVRLAKLYTDARCAGKPGNARNEKSHHGKGESWTQNSLPNVESTVKLLGALLPPVEDLHDLSESHFIDAFDVIQRLPIWHSKSCSDKRHPAVVVRETDEGERHEKARVRAALLAEGASPGKIEIEVNLVNAPRLRVATVYRHMQDAQRIIRYLVVLGLMSKNLMQDVIWKQGELPGLKALEEDNDRQTWGDRLGDLFRTPAFQEPLEDAGDPFYWAPLISIHASLRAEEVLQLRCDDIREEGGIAFLDIKVGSGQRLKSRAAKRRIPLHENLLELGLLELVALRRRQGEDRLFPFLERGKTRGALSEVFSKDFTRYRKRHGVYDKNRDFHSFRTEFNVGLIRSRVDSEIRHLLMGHEIRSVNLQHYGGEGYGLDHLREIVNLVKVDISMIRRRFEGFGASRQEQAEARPRLQIVS